MEVTPDKQSRHLIVTLSDTDIDTVLGGVSVERNDTTPKVTVSPLSEIDPESRRVDPTDGARVRKKLGALTSQATIMRDRVIIHVPEAFLDSAQHTESEQLTATDIVGSRADVGIDSIRIVLQSPESH